MFTSKQIALVVLLDGMPSETEVISQRRANSLASQARRAGQSLDDYLHQQIIEKAQGLIKSLQEEFAEGTVLRRYARPEDARADLALIQYHNEHAERLNFAGLQLEHLLKAYCAVIIGDSEISSQVRFAGFPIPFDRSGLVEDLNLDDLIASEQQQVALLLDCITTLSVANVHVNFDGYVLALPAIPSRYIDRVKAVTITNIQIADANQLTRCLHDQIRALRLNINVSSADKGEVFAHIASLPELDTFQKSATSPLIDVGQNRTQARAWSARGKQAFTIEALEELKKQWRDLSAIERYFEGAPMPWRDSVYRLIAQQIQAWSQPTEDKLADFQRMAAILPLLPRINPLRLQQLGYATYAAAVESLLMTHSLPTAMLGTIDWRHVVEALVTAEDPIESRLERIGGALSAYFPQSYQPLPEPSAPIAPVPSDSGLEDRPRPSAPPAPAQPALEENEAMQIAAAFAGPYMTEYSGSFSEMMRLLAACGDICAKAMDQGRPLAAHLYQRRYGASFIKVFESLRDTLARRDLDYNAEALVERFISLLLAAMKYDRGDKFPRSRARFVFLEKSHLHALLDMTQDRFSGLNDQVRSRLGSAPCSEDDRDAGMTKKEAVAASTTPWWQSVLSVFAAAESEAPVPAAPESSAVTVDDHILHFASTSASTDPVAVAPPPYPLLGDDMPVAAASGSGGGEGSTTPEPWDSGLPSVPTGPVRAVQGVETVSSTGLRRDEAGPTPA